MRALALLMLVTACDGGRSSNLPPLAILGDDLTVAPNESVPLSGAASRDPDGSITRWFWTFGDGATAEGAEVTHAWMNEAVYAVTLTVFDDLGAEATAAIRVDVTSGGGNQSPRAVVEGPGRGQPGELLSFAGNMSLDPDGTIESYHWDFGDGATGMGRRVEHTFSAEGEYAVTLVVVDDDEASGQASRTVVIGNVVGNQPPIAVAGPDRAGDVGVPLEVDGSGSTDPDGSIVRYAWDFGGGVFGNTPRASHTWAVPGTYVVELTVEDDAGAIATDEVQVTIAPPPSFDGNWVLNPNVAAVTCDNSHRTYQVPFPAPELEISGTTGGSVTALVVGQGRTMTGSVDRSVSPPVMSLSWTGSETDPTCGTATVEHQFSADMAPTALSQGRFSVIYTWTDAFCTCARTFDVSGAKR